MMADRMEGKKTSAGTCDGFCCLFNAICFCSWQMFFLKDGGVGELWVVECKISEWKW